MDLTGIETKRWEKGIPHDPRSIEIVNAIKQIDFEVFDDYFGWKTGGDGDNGESLMFELDIYFEAKDRSGPRPEDLVPPSYQPGGALYGRSK